MNFVDRRIIFHGNHFTEFYLEQIPKVQEKIEYVLRIVRQVERILKRFFDLKNKGNEKGRTKKG